VKIFRDHHRLTFTDFPTTICSKSLARIDGNV